MALTTVQAHAVATRAVPAALGRPVTDAELWAVLAVGRKESGFGNWTSPPHAPDMVTSRNWGAVQCKEHASRIRYLGVLGYDERATAERLTGELGSPSAVAGHCALALDYAPGRGWFVAPYRWYATDDEAAGHLARILHEDGALMAVRAQPDTYSLARAMFAGHYYTGGTKKAAVEVPAYAAALARHVREMADKLGVAVPPLSPTTTEADPGGSGPFPPDPAGTGDLGALRRALAREVVAVLSFRRNFIDPRVSDLQADLNRRGAGLQVDGWLGPKTLRAWLSDPREQP